MAFYISLRSLFYEPFFTNPFLRALGYNEQIHGPFALAMSEFDLPFCYQKFS